jgi:hypothetical protein
MKLPEHCHWNSNGQKWFIRFRKGRFSTYLTGKVGSQEFKAGYADALKGIKRKRKSLIDDFWRYVDQSRGPRNCWPWTRYRDKEGYGRATPKDLRQSPLVHRHVWTIVHGKIPKGLHVLHHCDNPACCNPSHLWLGTHQDNMKDRDRKGRWKDHWSGK